jgi:poly(A) polymerase
VLGRLDSLVKRWVRQVCLDQGFSNEVASDTNARIFTFGSFYLGVHEAGADIDTLLVAPHFCKRKEHFFGTFKRMLLELHDVQDVVAAENAHTPLLKMKLGGVSIDLLFAPLQYNTIPEDLDIKNNNVLKHCDQVTIRSLNGSRVAHYFLKLVPDEQVFRTALRLIKLWARRRGCYSNARGYLGGVNLAILTARTCQFYPNKNAAFIVTRFFRVFCNWPWPTPVKLREMETGPGLGLENWEAQPVPENKRPLMPLITPAFPSMNSTHNVNESSRTHIVNEIMRGWEICSKAQEDESSSIFNELIQPLDFFLLYKHYLRVDATAQEEGAFKAWEGFCDSRLRNLVTGIELVSNKQLKGHLSTETFEPKRLMKTWFIGLDESGKVKQQQDNDAKNGRNATYDISAAVRDFQEKIHNSQEYKVGNACTVSHVKRSKLPAFVYPDGKKPSQVTKRQRKDADEAADDEQQKENAQRAEDRLKERAPANANGNGPSLAQEAKPQKTAA